MNVQNIFNFFEDLVALSNKDYVESIRKARKEYEQGNVLSHEEIFDGL